ncbi:MAG: hypothetical protein JNL98_14195 [Bryobacterales bacterium]|nr:hypothetical protein [Bryobacterales bacterium]
MTPLIRQLALLAACVALNAETRPSVAVYMDFAEKPSASSIQAMQREVESLLKPAGLQLHWRDANEGNMGREDFTDLYVFRFNGRCHMDGVQFLFSELGPYGETVVLGTSKTVNHEILPFGSVECDPIRRSVTPAVIGRAHPRREQVLGRAMGRVLAHELFHMMTRRSKHSESGVFRDSQRTEYLVADEFGFDPAEEAELRRIGNRYTSPRR